jgi:peptidoglycan/xylan/chitin deacetylase (PgdA/CDA1 family)
MLWHEHLRRAAKLTIVGGLHYSGLLGVIRRRRMKDRALVLLYHRVNPAGYGAPDYSPVGMSVTPEEFDSQMRFIRERYDVVRLSRIVEAVRREDAFAPNLCAVTFDDGWEDVYRFAFPILRAQAIPATVFLTSGYIGGTGWAWEERGRYLLALIHQRRNSGGLAREASVVRAELLAHDLGDLLDRSDAELPGWLLARGRALKQLDAAGRDALMQTLERIAAPDAPRPFMTWDEVRAMAAHGIDVGNHTATHAALPELSDDDLHGELHGADADIQAAVGRRPVDVAYPYGKFDERVKRRVQQLGATSACTTHLGLVEPGADPFALNRVNMSSDVSAYAPLFAARILGL